MARQKAVSRCWPSSKCSVTRAFDSGAVATFRDTNFSLSPTSSSSVTPTGRFCTMVLRNPTTRPRSHASKRWKRGNFSWPVRMRSYQSLSLRSRALLDCVSIVMRQVPNGVVYDCAFPRPSMTSSDSLAFEKPVVAWETDSCCDLSTGCGAVPMVPDRALKKDPSASRRLWGWVYARRAAWRSGYVLRPRCRWAARGRLITPLPRGLIPLPKRLLIAHCSPSGSNEKALSRRFPSRAGLCQPYPFGLDRSRHHD